MSATSTIEWTDATWNPVVGCSVVSPGCQHCYAMKLAGGRLRNHPSRAGLTQPSKAGPVWTGKVRLWEPWLTQPFDWKTPRRIFVCAHGDLFHEDVPDEWIDKVFAVMALTPQHTYQVLTKRARRMRRYCTTIDTEPLHETVRRIAAAWPGNQPVPPEIVFPLANVWLGVSAEDQARADERIPHLLATPAAKRFISAEPLLGAIDLHDIPWPSDRPTFPETDDISDGRSALHVVEGTRLDWVIAGGESGTGARPSHPDWFRSLRDQCDAAGVPFFFKQWGAWLPVGQHLPGYGKIHGATAVKPGRMKLHYGGTREQAPQHVYAERGVDVWSLHDARLVFRVGKKAAGAELDGKLHRDFP